MPSRGTGLYAAVGEHAFRAAAAFELPEAMNALSDGAVPSFGTFSIPEKGVHRKNTVVPWANLRDLTVRRDYVVMKEKGKLLPLVHTPVSDVPNFGLLHSIVATAFAHEEGKAPEGR
ncbi:DUF6585 family protein [Kitasatospora sp. NPDC088134]|uniref:DUF6585 family protein n=1 Tax=Kitasatospora sp. NPDC088134 TaxID=3364071 RepID=UPI0038084FA8